MKKTNNLGLTKIITSVVLVLFILLLIIYIPKILAKDVPTILPLSFEYKETLPVQGILIKNEKVYFSKSKGEVYGIVDEGKRVPVGTEIAQVISLKDMTFYKSELDSIENLLKQIEINNLNTSENLSGRGTILDNIVSQIQINIQNEDYNSLKNLKEKLLINLDNDQNIQELENIGILTSEQLVEKKDKILKEISNYNERLFTNQSGIVSYKVDNVEEFLNPSDLDGVSEFLFDSDIKINLENENKNKAVFKIVDGHEYYVAIKTSTSNTSLFGNNESLEIEISNLGDDIHPLRLPIINRYTRGTEEILILKSNELLEKIYNYRIIDLEIVTFKKDSFKIPLETLTTIDGRQGVFVKSFYDVVVFRPIIINAQDDDFLYVDKGDKDNSIEIKGKAYKTINEYSEIIVNPKLVEEGKILK